MQTKLFKRGHSRLQFIKLLCDLILEPLAIMGNWIVVKIKFVFSPTLSNLDQSLSHLHLGLHCFMFMYIQTHEAKCVNFADSHTVVYEFSIQVNDLLPCALSSYAYLNKI